MNRYHIVWLRSRRRHRRHRGAGPRLVVPGLLFRLEPQKFLLPWFRIIHGKGIGTLRETVHAILKKDPGVERFELAGQGEGSWGATIAWLRQANDE